MTLVIAEPGCTHEGSYAAIVTLIHVAAECGATCFKNQWCSDPDQMIARRRVPVDPYRRYYGWLNYPLAWHEHFRRISHELGMQYACSVYLPADVATMNPYVDVLKVASFEAADPRMIEACRRHRVHQKIQVLVSLGMADVEDAIRIQDDWIDAIGNKDVEFLYCVSAYPAPLNALNLDALRLSRCDGFSDHSRHVMAGAIAVACGAGIVEAHLRLDDCSRSNPDYVTAFTPDGFAAYVENIRDAEAMIGNSIRRMQPCEVEMAKYRVGA